MVSPSQKLVDYGIIAALLGGAYLVWQYVYAAPKKTCPAGYHAVDPCEGQIGLPATLCNLGRNLTGAALDCKSDAGSPGPGGCQTTVAQCVASEMYLDVATCTCRSPQVGYMCSGKDRPTEVARLVAKLNAGECLTADELAWTYTCEKALHTLALQCKPVEGIQWKTCKDGQQVYPDMLCPEEIEKATLACNDGSYAKPSEGCPITPTTCWDGSVIDINHGQCPVKPDPSTYLVKCDCGANGILTIDTRDGSTCASACPPADFFKPVPTPGIVCRAGGAGALGNRPGRFWGHMSRSQCQTYHDYDDSTVIFYENDPVYGHGVCLNAMEREYQDYIHACGNG